jgi:hypothetical protein
VHAAASTNDCREKRNVLIVSVLLPIGVDLTLSSNTQRAIEVLWVCEQTMLRVSLLAPKNDAGSHINFLIFCAGPVPHHSFCGWRLMRE